MSLFDVIRYPVSSPPRPEELEVLPDALWLLWVHSSQWKGNPSSHDRVHTADWYQRNWPAILKFPSYEKDREDLQTLRRLIRDWDPPES